MKRLMLAALSFLFLSEPAWAGLEEARAAFKRGDYEMALREVRPLAEEGDARAQHARKTLGFETPAERFNACVASIG